MAMVTAMSMRLPSTDCRAQHARHGRAIHGRQGMAVMPEALNQMRWPRD
jgi:hypothetical protein